MAYVPQKLVQTLGGGDDMGGAGFATSAPSWANAGQPAQPQAQEPAYVQALRARLAQPISPTVSPEEAQQRRDSNARDYNLGLLMQLSGDESFAPIGGQMLKQALAAREKKITERGTTDPFSGQFTYNPEYLREKDEGAIGQYEQGRLAAADKAKLEADKNAAMLQGKQEHNELIRTLAAGKDGSSGMGGMVDALGTYTMDPASAFARMTPAARNNLITQVREKYPEYDPTTYSAKKAAALAFGAGTQGNALRSFAVAGQHLDQLGSLADALQSGDVQLINRAANLYKTQTGSEAPTNFEAAKDVVSKEVIKAIVGSGQSGVEEREHLAKLLDAAKSPAQLKGVIRQYRGLMEAQHDALIEQRRAAGLPALTQPSYGGNAPAPGAGGNVTDFSALPK
jgi:hypothetical protein